MPARVNQAQLERAVGGADKLLQLVDKAKTKNLASMECQEFIAEVLDEGNGEVDGYIGLAVDLGDPALQTAPMLVRYELAVDVYLTWMKGSGLVGGIPDQVQAEYDRVVGELQKIAERRKGIGLAVKPTASQQVQQITKTDTEDWFNAKGPRRRFDGWS